MISIKRYQPGDEKRIKPVERTLSGHPDYQSHWDAVVSPDWTWTAYCGDQVLGVCGLIPDEDRAFLWIMVDKGARKVAVMRAIRMGLRLMESFRLTLWTYIQNGFEAGERLAVHFGLHRVALNEEINCWMYERA